MASEISGTGGDLPRLPACRTCHDKKIKCDSERPRCLHCGSQGVDCVMVNPEGGPDISRVYVHELEQQLRGVAVSSPDKTDMPATSESPATTIHSSTTAVSTLPSVLQGGGLGFLSHLFNDPEWRSTNATLLQRLAAAARPAEVQIEANTLSDAADARLLFNAYLDGTHVQHPFLLRQDVLDLYDHVFVREVEDHRRQPLPSDTLFRTFMILAVGSVVPHRQGMHAAHPFGYYIAAMQNLDKAFLSRGLAAIQDLLLVCRFGIYYHTGTSIWEVAQLCIRMCIEQKLHLSSDGQPGTPLEEQMRRRVFWMSYVMDRYSSFTLSRPFAIADKDIGVGLPVHANDQEILDAAGAFALSLDGLFAGRGREGAEPVGPNDMSVALKCIELRRISSRIHQKTSQASKGSCSPAPGWAFALVDDFTHELAEWRASMPEFSTPRCLYENQSWYDFLEAREVLLLVRKAVDLVPKRNGLPPPHDMIVACLRSAHRTVVLFAALFRDSRITYTKSYFQTVFTAGLSILFCIISTASGAAGSQQLEKDDLAKARGALGDCEDTLRHMSAQLPDASPYAAVFEELHRNILHKLDHTQSPYPWQASIPASPTMTNAVVRQKTPSAQTHLELGHHHHHHHEQQHEQEGAATTTAAMGGPYGSNSFDPHDSMYNRPRAQMSEGGDLFGYDFSGEGDPSRWAGLAYDTIWNMGNDSFIDIGDMHGFGMDLHFGV